MYLYGWGVKNVDSIFIFFRVYVFVYFLACGIKKSLVNEVLIGWLVLCFVILLKESCWI